MPKTDSDSLADLQGFGPKSAAALHAVGIHTLADLKARDPFLLYLELKKTFPATSLNFLYAILGALHNKPWQHIQREQKTMILQRLEELGHAPK
jgi:DNA transformation protein and related proteins